MNREFNDELILEIRGVGSIRVKLDPALSPLTFSRLMKTLPSRVNGVRYGSLVIIPLDLGLVSEGRRTNLRALEVGYWVKKRGLVMAMDNVDVGESVNVIGYVKEGAELLSKLNGGFSVLIRHHS
jgi:hypothetical protein